MRATRPTVLVSSIALAAGLASLPALAIQPSELLAAYTAQAGSAPDASRGQKMFNTNFGRDLGLSCASCHGAVPVGPGKDQVTDKPIAPLAPSANPKRFTDRTKVETQFRLNCRDFVGRDCTPAEKADVLAWLMTLKP